MTGISTVTTIPMIAIIESVLKRKGLRFSFFHLEASPNSVNDVTSVLVSSISVQHDSTLLRLCWWLQAVPSAVRSVSALHLQSNRRAALHRGFAVSLPVARSGRFLLWTLLPAYSTPIPRYSCYPAGFPFSALSGSYTAGTHTAPRAGDFIGQNRILCVFLDAAVFPFIRQFLAGWYCLQALIDPFPRVPFRS